MKNETAMRYDTAMEILRGIYLTWVFDEEKQTDAAALRIAIDIMASAKIFADSIKKAQDEPFTQKKQEKPVMIDDLDLSVRSKHCLQRRGIMSVNELLSLSSREFHTIRGLGSCSMAEVRAALERKGFDASGLR